MIELLNIFKIYGDDENKVIALNDVSLTINKGELISIVGSSGSGKSTCMNIIGCLDRPTSGRYILNGKDVSKLKPVEQAHIRNKEIGFVFQQYHLIQKLSVLENVELPLLYRGISPKTRKKMALEALEKVGLSDKISQLPSKLSGGQQQRVSIARALAGNPPLLLADEPTGALDSKTSMEIMEFIKSLNADGMSVIIITHDMNIAKQTNRIITLFDGKISNDEVNHHES